MSDGDQAQASKGTIISVEKVRKSFMRGDQQLDVLTGLDLRIDEGSFEALMGPSGSGKSTLLNLIAGLDQPTAGKLMVAGADIGAMSEGQRAAWRASNIGFVFQTSNLLPVLTAD
jgi:putative ABC transport system ATP-binding protein